MELSAESRATPPSTLISNSRWNLIAFACALTSSFITIPFVVKWIGLAAFGRAGLVLAVCAPLLLVGTVLGQSVVREMSSRLGRGDTNGARGVVDASVRLCLVAGTVGWLALVVAGPSITAALLSEAASASALRFAFLISATGLFAQQLGLVLLSVCAARQDFRTMAGVAAFSAIANVVAVLALTSAIPTAEGYLSGVATGFLLSLVSWLWVLRRDVRRIRIAQGDQDGQSRALLRFAKWQSVAYVAGALGNQVDRYTLGALAPVAIVGQYNVANRLQEAAYIGVMKGGEVLFPRFGSVDRRSAVERGQFFQTASWVVGTFGAVVLAPMVPLSAAILTLWAGTEAAQGGALLLRTLVLGGVVGCASNVFVYYAMGTGRNAPVAFISVMYSVITVVSTVALIRAFGPVAAGAGLLIASVVRLTAALAVSRAVFFPHLSWGELVASTVVPAGTGVLLAIGAEWREVGAGVQNVIQLAGLYVALALAVLAATVASSTVTRSGRQIMRSTYDALRGRAPSAVAADEHP